MKSSFKISLIVFFLGLSSITFAQDQATLESQYTTFSGHKKYFNKQKWAMTRFHFVYKLTTAQITKSMTKNQDVSTKVKSSSGSYGILKGVNEEDLQNITNMVSEHIIKRLGEEAGIEIVTWSDIKDIKGASKIAEKADDAEQYSKSQGLGYAVSYDGTPVWNKVIQIIPGGKGIAKTLGANVMNMSFYIDFAQPTAEADTWIRVGRSTRSTVAVPGGWATRTITPYTYGESASQSIVPAVRVLPKLGSQSALEAATDIGISGVTGHSELLHSFTMIYSGADPVRLTSTIPYADKVEKFNGDIPAVLANRRNNKIEYVSTFEVHTTPEKYGLAVMDAVDGYISDLIDYYNLVNPNK